MAKTNTCKKVNSYSIRFLSYGLSKFAPNHTFSASELRKCTFVIFSNFKRLYFDNGNEYRVENWSATLFLATELESGLKKIKCVLFFKLFGLKVGSLFNRKLFLGCLGPPCAPSRGSYESQISDTSSTGA